MRNLAVIFGGESCEHDISIITALQALEAADKEKYKIFPVYIRNGEWYSGRLNSIEAYKNFGKAKKFKIWLKKNTLYKTGLFKLPKKIAAIDFALLAVHGGNGENGALQGLLEMHDVPYTSADVFASAVCMDKDKLRRFLRGLGYHIVKGNTVQRKEFEANKSRCISNIVRKMSFPVIIKPARLGSSIGIGIAANRAQLAAALEAAFCYDDKAVIEVYLEDKIELNCAAVKGANGNIYVSAIEKPLSKSQILSFADKYQGGAKSEFKRELPANITPELATEVRELTSKLYEELELFGIVRIDFLYDNKEGKLYVNEINTVPGSLSFYLFEECGIGFTRLIDIMIDASVARKADREKNITTYISNVLNGKFDISK